MRLNNIDVFSKPEKNKSNKKIDLSKLKTTQDVILADELSSCSSLDRPYKETELSKNILFIDYENNRDVKKIEDVIITDGKDKYTISGLILQPSLSKKYKKKFITTYFNNSIKEYNESVKKEEAKIKDIQSLTDLYEPNYIKFKTILTLFIIGVIFFFLFVKTDLLAKIPLIGKLFNFLYTQFTKTSLLNVGRYIIFLVPVLIMVIYIIINIVTKSLKRRYDNFSHNTVRFINKMKKTAKNKMDKLLKFYIKQINNFGKKPYEEYDMKKFDIMKLNSATITDINQENIKKMIKMVKKQKKTYKLRFLWILFGIILFVIYILLIIFTK